MKMAKPRWLTEDEQRTWRAFLATVELLDDALDRQLQADAGMTLAGYVTLAMLSETPGRSLRMSELARLANFSQSRLSHVVARHEERGWIRREKCPTDRRGSFAVLTDAGFEALAAAAPGHVGMVRRCFFDQLTPTQIHDLRDICDAALAALDPDGSLSDRCRSNPFDERRSDASQRVGTSGPLRE
jgi:DNA-binding MarR family transcriptional regulator